MTPREVRKTCKRWGLASDKLSPILVAAMVAFWRIGKRAGWNDGYIEGYRVAKELIKERQDGHVRIDSIDDFKRIVDCENEDDMSPAPGVVVGTKSTQKDRKPCYGSQEQPHIPDMTRGKPRPVDECLTDEDLKNYKKWVYGIDHD